MTEKTKNTCDVIVVGGGPGGLSAALWCRELGLETVLLEKEPELGGQLRQIFNPIENYLGLRAANGSELLGHFRKFVETSAFAGSLRCKVFKIDGAGRGVTLDDGTELFSRALVIATGVRRRKLGIPGEDEFVGKGIIASGAGNKDLARGKHVLIVGGGDAAIENALILSDVAAGVKVAFRRERSTARSEFLNDVAARDNITLVPNTALKSIGGDAVVSHVELEKVGTQQVRREPVDTVLIRIGVEPNSEMVRDVVELDDRGYILVDSICQTSAAGIFAAGDVANPISPTISTAAGTGATAAKTIYSFLKNEL